MTERPRKLDLFAKLSETSAVSSSPAVVSQYLADEFKRAYMNTPVQFTTPLTRTSSVAVWRWLASTRQLQEESFGVNPEGMSGEELADYIAYNHSALVVELGEFMAEVGWKPWVKPRGWVNREQAVRELIDVGHFLANLCCALGVTDEEWEARYREKQAVNRERQERGYDGRSEKCECGRAFEDGTRNESLLGYRCVCGRFNSDRL